MKMNKKILAVIVVTFLTSASLGGYLFMTYSAATVWSDGFESGQINPSPGAWSGNETSSGLRPAINSTIVFDGTYSAKCVTNGTQSDERSRMWKDLSGTINVGDSIYTRGAFYFEKGVPSSSSTYVWLLAYKNSSFDYVCYAGVKGGATPVFAIENSSWIPTFSSTPVAAGNWYDLCLRYDYYNNASAHIALYVNDTVVVEAHQDPSTNNNGVPSQMITGVVTTVSNTGNPIALFVDKYEVSSMYINAYTPFTSNSGSVALAAYVIDVSGTMYRMNNGTTGQVDFQSTNASAVINNALGNLAIGNSEVVLKGNFKLDSPLHPSINGTIICGSSARLVLANSANCAFFVIDHNDTTIEDLTLDGNALNQTSGYAAINISSPVQNLLVEKVEFQNVWQAGIKGVGGEHTTIVNGLRVLNCKGEDFENGTNHQGGLLYVDNGTDIVVDDIVCDKFGVASGVKIDGIKIIRSTDVTISNVQCLDVRAHGIFVGYGSRNALISDISYHLATIPGLEAVCAEFSNDGTDTGSICNENINIQNVQYTADSGGNNGIYCSSVRGLCITDYQCVINNVPIGNPCLALVNCNDTTVDDYHTILNPVPAVQNQHLFALNCNVLTLSNSIFEGYAPQDGSYLWLDHCTYVSVSNVQMCDSPNYTATFGPRAAIWIQYCHGITFDQLTVRNFSESVFKGDDWGQVIISSCTFEDVCLENSDGASRYLLYTTGNISDLNVEDCMVRLPNPPPYGIRGFCFWGTGNRNITFTNNDMQISFNDSYGFRYQYPIANFVLSQNLGYATENSGSATNATATTFIITHGLADTPTGVWCSFNSTEITAYTWTATTTTITVTVTGMTENTTCYWQAVYTP